MSIPKDIVTAMGNITSATMKKAEEVYSYAVSKGHKPSYVWGWGPNPDHNNRRCLDFMAYRTDGHAGIDKVTGDLIADYLWAHRKRLSVRHIIWRQRIRSTVVNPGVWRNMEDRGSLTNNHMDHVHVEFLDDTFIQDDHRSPSSKAAIRTLYWNKKKTQTGADVKKWQMEMNRVFPAYSRLTADGRFGPACDKVLREFQKRAGLTVDGRFGPKSRAAAITKYGLSL